MTESMIQTLLGVPLTTIAEYLPDGFAIVSKTTVTNGGIVDISAVLMTRAPDSGRLSRRVGQVMHLEDKLFRPFGDATYSAVNTLIGAGWQTDGLIDDSSHPKHP